MADNDNLESVIKRLDEALSMLRSGQFDGWYEAYRIADYKALADQSADWEAIRDIIIVAAHGAPEKLSYADQELNALIVRDSEED